MCLSWDLPANRALFMLEIFATGLENLTAIFQIDRIDNLKIDQKGTKTQIDGRTDGGDERMEEGPTFVTGR